MGGRHACMREKPEHMALSSRYAARSTALTCRSSGRISPCVNGSLSSCSAALCAPRLQSSICMSGLGPGVLLSSITQTSPEPPGCRLG